MAIVRGRAKTVGDSKYLQQLCKHWSHIFEVEFSETRGQVGFPSVVATMEASEDALLVSIETDDTESIERLEENVAIISTDSRFERRPLPFGWSATTDRWHP